MSNFSIIKLIDCCRSVIQYRQHILPDILHFACTPVKTEKHILDVFIPDFEQTALDHLCRHSFPIDLLICLCRTYCIHKVMVFPVVMYGCESWTINKAEHRRIDAFKLWCWRRLLRIPWTASRSNQSWIFIGRTDVEAETPILWSPDAKRWPIRKHPDDGKDWRRAEKGITEEEMVEWHHQLSGHEFE